MSYDQVMEATMSDKVRVLKCTCSKAHTFKRPSVLYYGRALVVRPCACKAIVTTIWYETGYVREL
jgi:hypothetical protein